MEDDYISRSAALACIEGYRERDGSIVSPDELPEYQRIEELPAANVIRRAQAIPLEWLVEKMCDKKLPWRQQRKFMHIIREWTKYEKERLNQQRSGD